MACTVMQRWKCGEMRIETHRHACLIRERKSCLLAWRNSRSYFELSPKSRLAFQVSESRTKIILWASCIERSGSQQIFIRLLFRLSTSNIFIFWPIFYPFNFLPLQLRIFYSIPSAPFYAMSEYTMVATVSGANTRVSNSLPSSICALNPV